MRRSSVNVKNFILQTACVLMVMVLVTTMMVCRLYARYTSRGYSADSARTAAFVFVVGGENSTKLDLSGIKKPGDIAEYTFTVENFKGDSVSETALDYTISLQLNGSMPLTCSITDITGDPAASVLQAQISKTDPLTLPLKAMSPSKAFQPSQKKTYTYKLTVEWPEDLNDAKYASRSAAAEVILTVSAKQVD